MTTEYRDHQIELPSASNDYHFQARLDEDGRTNDFKSIDEAKAAIDALELSKLMKVSLAGLTDYGEVEVTITGINRQNGHLNGSPNAYADVYVNHPYVRDLLRRWKVAFDLGQRLQAEARLFALRKGSTVSSPQRHALALAALEKSYAEQLALAESRVAIGGGPE